MDELTKRLQLKRLQLVEAISGSDAMTNARVDLEDAAADERIDGERWEQIRRWVFPLLERERERLSVECDHLRERLAEGRG